MRHCAMLRRTLLVVLIALAALALFGATYTPSTTIPAGFVGAHVKVHGIDVRVLQEGQGPDVLLIHGSPGSIEDWGPIRDGLRGVARVTAFDRPGNGYSGVTGEYSTAHNAEVALALIEQLGLREVTVVGHSYGGSTALAMALRAPARVKSYVILDSATYMPGRKATPLFYVLMVPGLGTGLARLSGEQLAAPRIRAGIVEQFNGRQPPAGFVELRTRIWSNPKVTRTIAAETIGAGESLAAQSPRYPEIKKPVRIVSQTDSPMRKQSAERLQRDIRGSTLRLLPGSGHYVQFDRPAEVLEEIRAALSAR
jgi:pimeloyl-ACP methyl ester carboxylesterase